MNTFIAEPIGRERFLLGEGPCYQADTATLSWVDVKGAAVWCMNEQGESDCLQTGQYVGAAIPTDHGRYVLMMTVGAYLADGYGLLGKLGKPEDMSIFQRFNDAKCDPQGRLFAGTMPLFDAPRRACGQLYAMSSNGLFRPIMTDTSVSNGLAWTKTGDKMYFADTGTKRIFVWDYDVASGQAENCRVAFQMEGCPDGMTIDEEDMLWIALWGDGTVVRVNPQDGQILSRVVVPARDVTSCCFGGESHNVLYITTSYEREPLNPMAGRIYRVRIPISGAPTIRFKEAEYAYQTDWG